MSNNKIPLALGFDPATNVNTGLEEFQLNLSDVGNVCSDTPSNGQGLVWSGGGDGSWCPSTLPTGGDPETVLTTVINRTGTTLHVGQAVFVSGNTGDNPEVGLALASNEERMPCIGVVGPNSINDNTTGTVISFGTDIVGTIGGTSPTPGKTIYISPTIAGGLTVDKPTAFNHLIQNIGVVLQVGGGNNKIKVTGVGRANDVPNTVNQQQGNSLASTSNTTLTTLASYSLPANTFELGKIVKVYVMGSIFQNTSEQNVTLGFELGADTPTLFSSTESWASSTSPSYFTIEAEIQPVAANTQFFTQEFKSTSRNGAGGSYGTYGLAGSSATQLALNDSEVNTITFKGKFDDQGQGSQAITVNVFRVEIA